MITSFTITTTGRNNVVVLFLHPSVTIGCITILFTLRFDIEVFVITLIFQTECDRSSIVSLFFQNNFLGNVFAVIQIAVILDCCISSIHDVQCILIVDCIYECITSIHIFEWFNAVLQISRNYAIDRSINHVTSL